jgi:hypothetical protein
MVYIFLTADGHGGSTLVTFDRSAETTRSMPKKAGVAIVFSLLIDGLELIFPCIGNNHPNLTFICFRGVETTNQLMICVVATNSIVTCDMT